MYSVLNDKFIAIKSAIEVKLQQVEVNVHVQLNMKCYTRLRESLLVMHESHDI